MGGVYTALILVGDQFGVPPDGEGASGLDHNPGGHGHAGHL
jgi:hypothetical protein